MPNICTCKTYLTNWCGQRTPLMAPQSETTKPSKPHSSRRRALQQAGLGAGGLPVERVVGAHHAAGAAALHARLEGWQVCGFHVPTPLIHPSRQPMSTQLLVHQQLSACAEGRHNEIHNRLKRLPSVLGISGLMTGIHSSLRLVERQMGHCQDVVSTFLPLRHLCIKCGPGEAVRNLQGVCSKVLAGCSNLKII